MKEKQKEIRESRQTIDLFSSRDVIVCHYSYEFWSKNFQELTSDGTSSEVQASSSLTVFVGFSSFLRRDVIYFWRLIFRIITSF